MKIAVTAPPWISTPPQGYGGIELFVTNLVEGLVKKGHNVTLYATGDSTTSAQLDYFYKKALGNHLNNKLNPFYILNHLNHFYKNASTKYDVIHDNGSDLMLSLFFSDFVTKPILFTLHGAYADNVKDLFSSYGITKSTKDALLQYANKPYISISNDQRKRIPQLNYINTIYHGIHLSQFEFNRNGSNDMTWLGRVNTTKGIDTALKTAIQLKKKIQLAGYVDEGDKEYYNLKIKPLLNNEYVAWQNEIKDIKSKSTFFGNSKLFLFPLRWDEPFGIVSIEAMATGTPVVAFAMGSLPELIKDGETGFIVNPSDDDIRGNWIIKKTGFEGLCEAVERIYAMTKNEYVTIRETCRTHVEKNFTVETMVDKYEAVYEQIIQMNKSL